jgi:O-antigen ligase
MACRFLCLQDSLDLLRYLLTDLPGSKYALISRNSPKQMSVYPISERRWRVVAIAVATGMGCLIPVELAAAAIPIAMGGAFALLMSGHARIIFIVFGGLIAITGDTVSLKVLYSAGVTFAFIGASVNLLRCPSSNWSSWLPVVPATIVAVVVLGASWLVATAHGTGLYPWASSTVAYWLFLTVPIFAMDARSTCSRRFILAVFLTGAAVSSLSLFIQWSTARSLVNLPIGHLAYASWLLPASAACYATVRAFGGDRISLGWLSFAVVLFALYAATGTRSSFVWIPGMAAAAALTARTIRSRVGRAVGFVAISSALLVAIGAAIVITTNIDVSSLANRYSSVEILLRNPGLDPSYSSRLLQTQLAWQQFLDGPILGAGPGYSFFVANSLSGDVRFSIGLDSPAATLSEFGVLGVVMIATLLISYVVMVRRWSKSADGDTNARIVLSAVGLMSVIWLLGFGSPINDKGFSLAMYCICALALPFSVGTTQVVSRIRESSEFHIAYRWGSPQLS